MRSGNCIDPNCFLLKRLFEVKFISDTVQGIAPIARIAIGLHTDQIISTEFSSYIPRATDLVSRC